MSYEENKISNLIDAGLAEKELQDNNVMIAEFMEFEKDDNGYYHDKDGIVKAWGWIDNVFAPKNLRFHISWDWLMVVVGKIRSLDEFKGGKQIATKHGGKEMHRGLLIQDIELVYIGVTLFIQWYNQQNK